MDLSEMFENCFNIAALCFEHYILLSPTDMTTVLTVSFYNTVYIRTFIQQLSSEGAGTELYIESTAW